MIETVKAVYDENTSRNWSPDPEVNALFIRNVGSSCYDTLKARGHLFLNDVHDQLGLPRTSRGQLIGWLSEVKGELWEWKTENRVGGEAQPIQFTFKTQGEIYDKIEEQS